MDGFIIMVYAKIAFDLPIDKLFDYFIPQHLTNNCSAGCRVIVSLGRHKLVGYVVSLSQKTKIPKVKPILELIDPRPILSPGFLRLAGMVAQYYCCSLGQAIGAGLPAGIRRGLKVSTADIIPRNRKGSPQVSLVRDDSFSSRIDFYCREISSIRQNGKTVLIITAEINSAIRIGSCLRDRYSAQIAVSYRKKGLKEELAVWQGSGCENFGIIIGTRSVVFSPTANLGLIIVDSEDGYGLKEEHSPYYHSRDVALMRARLEGIPLILTSTTPSLESYYAAKRKKYKLIDLADTRASSAKITIVDMKQYSFLKNKSQTIISIALEDRINKTLAAGKKAIVFINKKGFARYAYCQRCGHILSCDKCSLKLVYFFDIKKLRCSSCGRQKDAPSLCPNCNANYLRYAGAGIEKIINQLSLFFPGVKISRLDREHKLSEFSSSILVTTEMVFHQDLRLKASLVGVIDLDSALNIVSYRNNEKVYSLLYKLRLLAEDELLIQTHLAEYYSLLKKKNLNLDQLFDSELKDRKVLGLPPFMRLATLNLRSKNLQRLKAESARIYERLKSTNEKISVFAPLEASPFKLRGNFRYSILLKAKRQPTLSRFLKKHLRNLRPSGIILTVDVDPQ